MYLCCKELQISLRYIFLLKESGMIGLRIESTVLVWEDESVRVCVFACVYGCVFRVNVCVYVSCVCVCVHVSV